MPIVRINEFHAASGQETALLACLRGVIETIQTSPGCQRCDLFIDPDDASRLAIVETWDSIPLHQAAATRIPPEQLGRVQPLLAEPPRGRYYQPVP